MSRGWLYALKLLVLITMYLVTFFMRRLTVWFEFDLFLLILMSMYTVALCGKGFRVMYVVLAIGFFAKLVLEMDLTEFMIPSWYFFVVLMSVMYCVSVVFSKKGGD